jgi:hypothetical protein
MADPYSLRLSLISTTRSLSYAAYLRRRLWAFGIRDWRRRFACEWRFVVAAVDPRDSEFTRAKCGDTVFAVERENSDAPWRLVARDPHMDSDGVDGSGRHMTAGSGGSGGSGNLGGSSDRAVADSNKSRDGVANSRVDHSAETDNVKCGVPPPAYSSLRYVTDLLPTQFDDDYGCEFAKNAAPMDVECRDGVVYAHASATTMRGDDGDGDLLALFVTDPRVSTSNTDANETVASTSVPASEPRVAGDCGDERKQYAFRVLARRDRRRRRVAEPSVRMPAVTPLVLLPMLSDIRVCGVWHMSATLHVAVVQTPGYLHAIDLAGATATDATGYIASGTHDVPLAISAAAGRKYPQQRRRPGSAHELVALDTTANTLLSRRWTTYSKASEHVHAFAVCDGNVFVAFSYGSANGHTVALTLVRRRDNRGGGNGGSDNGSKSDGSVAFDFSLRLVPFDVTRSEPVPHMPHARLLRVVYGARRSASEAALRVEWKLMVVERRFGAGTGDVVAPYLAFRDLAYQRDRSLFFSRADQDAGADDGDAARENAAGFSRHGISNLGDGDGRDDQKNASGDDQEDDREADAGAAEFFEVRPIVGIAATACGSGMCGLVTADRDGISRRVWAAAFSPLGGPRDLAHIVTAYCCAM